MPTGQKHAVSASDILSSPLCLLLFVQSVYPEFLYDCLYDTPRRTVLTELRIAPSMARQEILYPRLHLVAVVF